MVRKKNFYAYRGLKRQQEENGDGFDVYCIRSVTITILVLNSSLIARL